MKSHLVYLFDFLNVIEIPLGLDFEIDIYYSFENVIVLYIIFLLLLYKPSIAGLPYLWSNQTSIYEANYIINQVVRFHNIYYHSYFYFFQEKIIYE
jgi:hypothetical protein